jgi:hypothetical protein
MALYFSIVIDVMFDWLSVVVLMELRVAVRAAETMVITWSFD